MQAGGRTNAQEWVSGLAVGEGEASGVWDDSVADEWGSQSTGAGPMEEDTPIQGDIHPQAEGHRNFESGNALLGALEDRSRGAGHHVQGARGCVTATRVAQTASAQEEGFVDKTAQAAYGKEGMESGTDMSDAELDGSMEVTYLKART